MRVSIPIAYDVWVTSTRTGESSDRRFGHVVEAEIREVEGWQAPVAARWTSSIGGHGDKTVETRWLDESHWRRLQRSKGDPGPVAAEDFLASCSAGRPSEGGIKKAIDAPDLRFPGPGGKVVKFNPKLWICNSNVPERAEAIMREALDGYVSIDGEIWMRCGEPVYRIVRHQYDGTPLAVTVLALDDEWHDILDRQRTGSDDMYRADRGDVALDDFKSMGGEMSGKPHLEIHLPESIRYKDDEAALQWGARRLLDDRKNDRIGQIPAEEAIAWGRLRLAFQQTLSHDGGCEDLADRMREYLDATDSRQTGPAEAALFRWSTRSIEVSDDPSDLPGGPR